MSEKKNVIESGNAILGCELGSTTIKATLITADGVALSSGSHLWENRLVGGLWTYDLDDVWSGLAHSIADLAANVRRQYGASFESIAAAGFSAMMHGYIVVDKQDNLLVPFRTWRNNITATAARELTELFDWPIPQRWSIAHLYQAILNGEEHVPRIARLTTLAGFVHWKLTGEWKIGIGDASGVFPVNPGSGGYDERMLDIFGRLVAKRGLPWQLEDLLPEVVAVGEPAGRLSAEGARILDPTGRLQPGAPLCPPEGDAGTGMVVTNSVRPRTGNVSAGTSVFAMLVLEGRLSRLHPEIDLVLTPDGRLVAMAHSNNCTSDLNAWIALFAQVVRAMGAECADADLYGLLMPLALESDPDAGGLMSFGYLSGEHVTGFEEGRPLFVRRPDAEFTLANFIRSHLYSALCALRIGLEVLTEDEGVNVDELRGHGGFFKTATVGQRIMAAATNTPVSLPTGAAEGGAWGMALLAAYQLRRDRSLALADYLDALIGDSIEAPLSPHPDDVDGFNRYLARYKSGLPVESAAVNCV